MRGDPDRILPPAAQPDLAELRPSRRAEKYVDRENFLVLRVGAVPPAANGDRVYQATKIPPDEADAHPAGFLYEKTAGTYIAESRIP